MRRVKLFLFGIIILSCIGTGVNGQIAAKPSVFSTDPEALVANKRKIQNKNPKLIKSYKQLIKDAELELKFGPVSVTEKKNMPPSGNMHDYMSLAPYYWPDPSKKDGLPYLRKDGETNPEVKEYKDKEYMPKLCEAVYTLGLAYYYSGNEKYAGHAAKLLRVWFLDSSTKMNPNLNFGQAIRGTNTGRGAGLIDSRHFIKVVDAIGLMKGSEFWKMEDQDGMKLWLSDFLNWMQTSSNGIDEMNALNNHGVWYDALRLAIALFIDRIDMAKKIVENSQKRLDYQMDINGSFPKEMERTTSLHYSVFVIQAFFTIANMAEKTGIDLWQYKSPSGKSLKKGFDTFLPFISHESKWEGQQIKPFDFGESVPLLIEGARQFNCQKCMVNIKKIEGAKFERLRIRLLTNINL